MKYYIFQLPISHNNCYRGWSKNMESVRLRDYVEVYKGNIDIDRSLDMTLEKIFELLNIGDVKDYYARSLSVSDLIYCEWNHEWKWFYVDSFGFKEIPEKEIRI